VCLVKFLQIRWYCRQFAVAAAGVVVDDDDDSFDDVRARELARQKREMCQRFMKEEQARRLEESQRAHEIQKAEDQRIAEIAREKALKDELFKAKKASDDDSRQLIRQQVSIVTHWTHSSVMWHHVTDTPLL